MKNHMLVTISGLGAKRVATLDSRGGLMVTLSFPTLDEGQQLGPGLLLAVDLLLAGR